VYIEENSGAKVLRQGHRENQPFWDIVHMDQITTTKMFVIKTPAVMKNFSKGSRCNIGLFARV
jgi:hypothetical protein